MLDSVKALLRKAHLLGPDEAEQAAALVAEAQTLAAEQELRDLRDILSTPAGRRVLWRLLERAGIYRSSFSTEPLEMARAEGRRATGLQLLQDILAVSPDAWVLMQREHAPDTTHAKSA